MSIRTLAHISDLHIGRDSDTNLAAAHIRDRILQLGIDHVIVTGDVTHRGRAEEWALFEAIFLSLGARRELLASLGQLAGMLHQGEAAVDLLRQLVTQFRGGLPRAEPA